MLCTYLARFSNGAFADLARIMLEKLEGGREERVAQVEPRQQIRPGKTGAAKQLTRDITSTVTIDEIDIAGTRWPAIGVEISSIAPQMARTLGFAANSDAGGIKVNPVGPADLGDDPPWFVT